MGGGAVSRCYGCACCMTPYEKTSKVLGVELQPTEPTEGCPCGQQYSLYCFCRVEKYIEHAALEERARIVSWIRWQMGPDNKTGIGFITEGALRFISRGEASSKTCKQCGGVFEQQSASDKECSCRQRGSI